MSHLKQLKKRAVTPTNPLRVAVDVTPLLPGGENGGAKVMVNALLRELGRIPRGMTFILLTSGSSHDELSPLEGPFMTRHLARYDQIPKENGVSHRGRLLANAQRFLAGILPPALFNKVKGVYLSRVLNQHATRPDPLLKDLGADLLFCPFTASHFYDPRIPMVSTVYDLQYAVYPQFFTPEDRLHREISMHKAVRFSRTVICISDYIRSCIIDKLGVLPERIKTIPIQTAQRFSKTSPRSAEEILNRLKLTTDRYLFYPANFWPHKNHRMLLTAFGVFHRQNTGNGLKLVFTGTPGPLQDALRNDAGRMGLGEKVVFANFVPEGDLSVLMENCRALIFPSLYEGFGMPVLEAMAFGKPVLCSQLTSLPEIAGEAGIYFDPRKPLDMVRAITAVEREPGKMAGLVAKGPARAALFGDTSRMAAAYTLVFKEALADSLKSTGRSKKEPLAHPAGKS